MNTFQKATSKSPARPLSLLLAQAFDCAASNVAEAHQVHDHYGDPAPGTWQKWVYWCRGFAAGVAGDANSMPLSSRFLSAVRRAWSEFKSII